MAGNRRRRRKAADEPPPLEPLPLDPPPLETLPLQPPPLDPPPLQPPPLQRRFPARAYWLGKPRNFIILAFIVVFLSFYDALKRGKLPDIRRDRPGSVDISSGGKGRMPPARAVLRFVPSDRVRMLVEQGGLDKRRLEGHRGVRRPRLAVVAGNLTKDSKSLMILTLVKGLVDLGYSLEILHSSLDTGNYFVIPEYPVDFWATESFFKSNSRNMLCEAYGFIEDDLVIIVLGNFFFYNQFSSEYVDAIYALSPLLELAKTEKATDLSGIPKFILLFGESIDNYTHAVQTLASDLGLPDGSLFRFGLDLIYKSYF